MNPFFFGDSAQQLFGIYHPSLTRSTRGVVICHPWAREYLLAYPTLKLLAHRLSEAGWHVLRFDYFGTGDSAGDSRAGHADHWVRDVQAAMEELEALADVREFALVGMRLGAVMAARASRYRTVRQLVLWDPVTDGRSYLAEMGAMSPPARHDDSDLLGAILTHQLRTDMERITPASLGDPASRTLILASDPDTAVEPLAARLRSLGTDASTMSVPDVPVWRTEWERGGKGLAVSAANYITTWLS
ncbi:MAG TPA: alpha/beta hydrolase [Gemmatimonadaceae bacterium]|nr:alpha/beta hydrolase [Gemmatimonadaceae bacterium]